MQTAVSACTPEAQQSFTSLRQLMPTVTLTVALLAMAMVARTGSAANAESAAGAYRVIAGKPSGLGLGDYAPDFQLEPVEMSADFKRWLGDRAPKKFEDKVMLSDFVGKAPIVLLFGSFT